MALTRLQITIAVGIPLSYIIWGYLTWWIPRIHLLPYAFVAGIITAVVGLFAVVGLSSSRSEEEYYEQNATVAAAFAGPEAWEEAKTWLKDSTEYRKKQLWPDLPAVSESVDKVLAWIYRDFVTSWYANISRTPNFVNEIDRAIKGAFYTVRGRIADQDMIKVGVSRFVPIITAHLRQFHEAEVAVRGKDLNRSVTESEELDLAIASKYKDGKLHPAASLTFSDTKMVQQEYMRRLVRKLLPKVLPAPFIASKAVRVLVQEIVSCAVLVPVMILLATPDTWNQVVEAYGRTMLQDRKSVQKLRKALDEHASPVAQKTAPRTFPRLTPGDDERKYERYLRAIRKCNNLSEARRFRSEVASQLKRAVDAGVSDQVYVGRLETSKRFLDQQVGLLSAIGSSSEVATVPEPKPKPKADDKSGTSTMRLQDVLYSASGLSYFMEFMDRLGLMTLVQFYVVVDGFRNPLEDDFIEGHKVAESSLKWTDSDRQDIAQINQGYLSRLELRIPATSREAVRTFLKAGKNATPVQYQRARSAILRSQTLIFEEMRDKYFTEFRNSDLWYKFVTAAEAAAKAKSQTDLTALKLQGTESVRSSLDSPTKMSRSEFQKPPRPTDALTRNAVSATNLEGMRRRSENGPSKPRVSFETSSTLSKPLFDDEVEPEAMGQSIASLDEYDDLTPSQATGDDPNVFNAMQAALDDIMANEGEESESLQDSVVEPSRVPLFGDEVQSARNSGEIIRTSSPALGKHGKPDLASLGLVKTSSRIGVVKDDDLFGDEPKFKEDEQEEPTATSTGESPEEQIHQAAPGDLGLAEAITALTTEIDKLVAQENIVDTLNRKAELTNNLAELRILRKSKESLQREIRRKELQRQQYIVQESDNSLYGRASVEIKSVVVGKEPDGQEFALYVIEVRRQAGENMSAASWAIARRYSEFHELHQRLRNIYPAVRELEFPRRRIMMKLQRDFLHKRRVSLQNYLRDILRMPDVCQSRDLRSFLSQQAIISTDSAQGTDGSRADIVSRIYNSVTDGMDEFLGNLPVLDQLTAAGQNLISAATAQYTDPAGVATTPGGQTIGAMPGDMPIGPGDINTHVVRAREAQAELDAFDATDAQLEPFVKPISDLFLETFELNRSQNWLRGRAVVVVLHQLLGGTIERKIREIANSLVGEQSVLKYIESAKEALWNKDGSGLRKDKLPRTVAERKASHKEASVTLAHLIPELAGNVVGRDNAKRAARKVFAAANNERLNAHLAFRLLDEIVVVIWPEMANEVGRM